MAQTPLTAARPSPDNEPALFGDLFASQIFRNERESSIQPSLPSVVHSSAPPRPLVWLIRSAVLIAAVAAPLLAFAGEKKVTVDVEGRVERVRTYANSPYELLERSGVDARQDDKVASSGSEVDGQKITFRKAKPISLVVDGEPREVLAHGLTVGEALAGLGMDPGPKDHVFPATTSQLKEGMSLSVRNAVHARVRVDGRVRDVVSSGESVSQLLAQAGVEVGENDYVIPGRKLEPSDGMWIRVVRVRRIVEVRHVQVPFQRVTQRDPELESGVRKIVQTGAEGTKVRRIQFVLEDGKRVSSAILSEEMTRDPRNHIVRVGTKAPTYDGGGHTQKGIASWYGADGLVAAHRTLPFGTVVKVTNLDTGKSVNVRIADRGPYVDGRVIDLSDDAFSEVAPLGSGTFNSKIEW